jgi:hypothetical protein
MRLLLIFAWFAAELATAVGTTAGQSSEVADLAPQRPGSGSGSSAGDIERWVLGLESDRFELREAAMSHLIGAGQDAIDAVTQAVMTGKLETITRGLTILRELALSEDLEVEQAARSALERIAGAKITAGAHRASATLRALDEIRQDRALRRLQALGARIDEARIFVGQPPGAELYIQFDSRWQGEVADLHYLLWLTGFGSIHLTLSGDRVNDDWLRALQRSQNVTSLELKRVHISDGGLAHVTELANLQQLRLLYCPITDAGLEHLGKLKQAGVGGNFTLLQVYGTNITPEGSKRLEKALEGAKVDCRRGGFLGISGAPVHNAGCVVERVEPNTAAARAGIQAGDIILSYAGDKVEDFEGLTQLIARHEPGERVTLEVLRGEAQFQTEVTLGFWQ